MLAPETSDRNSSEGPVLRLSEGSKRMPTKFSFFSLWKGNIPPFLFLCHSPLDSIGNSMQELSYTGGGVNGFSPFPFPLSLFTNEHRGNQYIHLAVSLSSLILLIKNKIISSLYIVHLKLFTILYILLKPLGIFLITLKKKPKFKLSKNSYISL
jgi:hypothetical protein